LSKHQNIETTNEKKKKEVTTSLEDVSKLIEKLSSESADHLNQDNFIKVLNDVEKIIQNRIDYDYKLRFNIHGLDMEPSFSKMVKRITLNHEKVEFLGRRLNQLSQSSPRLLQLLKTNTNLDTNIRQEVRNSTHKFYFEKN